MNMNTEKAKCLTAVVGSIAVFSLASAVLCTSWLKQIAWKDAKYDPRETVVYFKSPINPEIEPDSVIADVNGKSITRADYEKWTAIRSRVFCIVNGLEPSKKSVKVDNYNSKNKEVALADLIRRELVRQECKRTGVHASSSDIETAQKKFMKDIKKPNVSFEEFCRVLPPAEAAELAKQVEEDARGEVLLAKSSAYDLETVTDEDLNARLEVIAKARADVAELNAAAKKKAADAKAEVLAGKPFAEVTESRAEIFPEEGREWDTIELDELEPEEDLFKFLAKSKAGDISDPIDMDDGIGIVGVVAIVQADEDDSASPDQYVLVRCMFNGYDTVDEPTEPALLRKQILNERRASAQKELIDSLMKKSVIELPFGKMLFAKPKVQKKDPAGV